MVAIAKQGDLGHSHPNAALDFAIASRNSLADITGRRDAKVHFQIGADCTHIDADENVSLQQIQKAWGLSLDKASRLVASAPENHIQINTEMRNQIDARFKLMPYAVNYIVT